jgi:hypothetical protein
MTMRKKTVFAAGLLAAMLMSIGGCTPRVAGFFGDKPVDRATFERQAAKRRGELEVQRAMLKAKLTAAETSGEPAEVAAVRADMAIHEAESKTYNEFYGQGVEDLNRQAEANEQTFTALTAAGEYGAATAGIPPGVSQLALGVILAFAGRAGWIRIRQPKPTTTPPPVAA